jgi:hypothetical protein
MYRKVWLRLYDEKGNRSRKIVSKTERVIF